MISLKMFAATGLSVFCLVAFPTLARTTELPTNKNNPHVTEDTAKKAEKTQVGQCWIEKSATGDCTAYISDGKTWHTLRTNPNKTENPMGADKPVPHCGRNRVVKIGTQFFIMYSGGS